MPRKGGPHPQHIKLGSFHRTCQTEPVQQRLSSLELARMVGLRYRCTGWYGLPYSASAVPELWNWVILPRWKVLLHYYWVPAPQAQHVKMIFPPATICRKLPCRSWGTLVWRRYDAERPKGFRKENNWWVPVVVWLFSTEQKIHWFAAATEQPFFVVRPCAQCQCSESMPPCQSVLMRWTGYALVKEDKSNRDAESGFLRIGTDEWNGGNGCIIRLQGLNKTLEWDGANMCFTNIGDNETLRTCIKDGFTIHDGHPSFNKTWQIRSTRNNSQELVKHNYREGWKLPDMPR